STQHRIVPGHHAGIPEQDTVATRAQGAGWLAVAKVGKGKPVLYGHQPNQENQDDRRCHIDIASHLQVEQNEIKDSAGEAGRSVDLFAAKDRRLIGQHIAQHASHYRGEHAHDGGYLGSHTQPQRLLNTQYRKERNSESIEYQEGAFKALQRLNENERDYNTGQDRIQVSTIANPYQGITAEHYIAERTATDGRDEPREAGAEQIIVMVLYCQRARDRKEECAEHFECVLKPHDLFKSV